MIAENKPNPPEDGQPSNAGSNGRDKKGLFAQGNKIGKGNPTARKMCLMRSEALKIVKRSDARRLVKKLLAMAGDGDMDAMKIILDRIMGKAIDLPLEASQEGEGEINIQTTPEALRELLQSAGKRYLGEPKA